MLLLCLGGGFGSLGAAEQPPVVRTSHPALSVHSANYPLHVTVVVGPQGLREDGLEVSVDGESMTSQAQIKHTAFTWQLSLPLDLTRATRHNYQLRLTYPDGHAQVLPVEFQTDVRGPGDLVIETEDFNYDGGRFDLKAARPDYEGGAYEGRAAILGIDYYQASLTNLWVADDYRRGEIPNVTLLYSDERERIGYDLENNWILMAQAGDWFHYTRIFPTNFYQVYAALSSDQSRSELSGVLALVTRSSVTPLGTFQGRSAAEANWGENVLVPLVSPTGNETASVWLGGEQTLRFTVEAGAIDYLLFVAKPTLRATRLAGGALRLDWDGKAHLESADSPRGIYQPVDAGDRPPVIVNPRIEQSYFRLKEGNLSDGPPAQPAKCTPE